MADEELVVDEDKGAKKGGNNLIIMIAAVVLGLGVGGAGMFFVAGGGEEDGAEEAVADVEPERVQSIYHALDKPFIIGFDTKGKQRYLQVNMQFRGKDQAAFDVLAKHDPVVKTRLNALLSSQDLSALQTDAGRVQLIAEATTTVQELLQEKMGAPGIEQAIFTTFVMQ